MKKLLLTLFLALGLLSSVNVAAARFVVTEGDFATVNSDTPVKVVIDFDSTTVTELPLDEYLIDINHGEEFKQELNNYYADFITRFNRRCEQLTLTRSGERALQLTVKVTTIVPKGNEAAIEYIFTDTATGKRLVVVTGTVKEGRYGSFSNLVGDVMREAGGNFGAFVAGKLKKSKVADDPIYK